jgi:hypothetical protein
MRAGKRSRRIAKCYANRIIEPNLEYRKELAINNDLITGKYLNLIRPDHKSKEGFKQTRRHKIISKYIDLIIAPFLKKASIWIQESIWRVLSSIAFLALSLALGIMLSKWLAFNKIRHLLFQLFYFTYDVSSRYTTCLLWIVIGFFIIVIIYLIKKEKKAKKIEVKMNRWGKPEDYFIVAPESDWNYVDDDESFGKVLSVTNSGLTGHLKKGDEWCDYILKFKAKIIGSNFSFAIRVADRNNCIFFQCAEKTIFPHLIMGGITVRHYNDMVLPLEIPKNKWVEVSVLVRTKKAEINIMGMRKEYVIPSFRRYVYANSITPVMEFNQVNSMHEEISKNVSIIEELNNDIYKLNQSLEGGGQEGQIKSDIKKKQDEILQTQNSYKGTIVIIGYDFERGTVGFREYGNEHALFKDISVELLDKI